MKVNKKAILLALFLTGCTSSVPPAFHDRDIRTLPCTAGGPDQVAQAFYAARLRYPQNGLPDRAELRRLSPYLSESLWQALHDARRNPAISNYSQGDIFAGYPLLPTRVTVAPAPTIPNRDAHNIPLRVMFERQQAGRRLLWQEEVLMVREGRCWTLDDVRYLNNTTPPYSSLRYALGAFMPRYNVSR